MLLEAETDEGLRRVEIGPANPRVLVGRHADCEMRVSEPTVSRRHAEFLWTPAGVQLADMGSTAGTFVNGERVQQTRVAAGDEIRCGGQRIRLVERRSAPEPAARGSAGTERDFGDEPAAAPRAGSGGVDDFFSPSAPPELPDLPPAAEEGAARRPRSRGRALADTLEPDEVLGGKSGKTLHDEGDGPKGPRSSGVGFGPTVEAPAISPSAAARDALAFGRTEEAPAFPKPAAKPAPRPAIEGFVLAWHGDDGVEVRTALPRGGGPIVIGRNPEVDIRVSESTVSRRHCRIGWSGDALEVEDLGSTAGTMVNGRKVKRARASAGDLVTCGRLEIRIEALPGEPARAPAPKEDSAVLAAVGTWELIYTDPEGQEYGLEIRPGDDWAVIGRMPDLSLTVAERSVGRQHCKVGWEGGRLVAVDLDSTNGTYVNDERVKKKALAAGDVLRLGNCEIRVLGPPPPDSGEAAPDFAWDDAWTDEADAGPPAWYLLYLDDEERLCREVLGQDCRVLAIGADPDCEVSASHRGLERDHCEVTWEEGVVIARDLDTEVGTLVKGRRIDERVLRNGDILQCGELRVHVIRGPESGRSGAVEIRSEEADRWARHLRAREAGLCLVFAADDPTRATARTELTLWGDGEGRLELVSDEERTSRDARVAPGVLDLVLDGLLRAGYPDSPPARLEDGESPVEVTAFHEDDQASVLLGRRGLARSEAYREVVEVLSVVVSEIRAG